MPKGHILMMNFKGLALFLMVTSNVVSEENSSGCTCVPFYLCENGTINKNGEGLVDIRIKMDQNCTSYLEFCCEDNDLVPEARLPRASPAAQGCGRRNSDGIGFRTTGNEDNEAQFGEFPWMIAIFQKKKNSRTHTYVCGGSLIHPKVVLTAAHCIKSVEDHYKIRAGEWDSQTKNEIYSHQDMDVESIVVHPKFDPIYLQNNIALLFLKESVSLAAHINVACLPPQGTVASGSGCFVSGWGKSKFDPGAQYQSILKRIEVPVMARELCQKAFRTTRLGSNFVLDPTYMCAGGEEGVDSCTGDGGGPLVCPIEEEEDRYQQVGMVAWGIGCGAKGIPGAYVDVASFRNWIDQQLEKNKINTNMYRY